MGNPAGNVCDIEALARVAHAHGVPLIVDNTVATPILLRPIVHGADIVVHSLTKFMGGHGVAMGGAIVDSGLFDWKARASRFPMFSEPDESYHGLVYADRFGREAFVARARAVYQRTTGAVLAPMSAFLLLQGIETVSVRMERHVENARAVAQFLRADPRVAWVDYVGFPDSPYHALANKYLGGRAPSLLTFGVEGGIREAKAFYDALKLVKRLVNIGDVRSLCCHPASTTHRQMTPDEQLRAGVRAETIRLERRDRAYRRHRRRPRAGACAPRFRSRVRSRPSSAVPVAIEAPSAEAAVTDLRERRLRRGSIRERGKRLRIGLVNNMPDAAWSATERQFAGLLDDAAEDFDIRLSLWTLETLDRQRETRRAMAGRYRTVRELRGAERDALIVTGAEPRAPDLRQEPYWRELTALFDWAEARTFSTVLSCLAAHASVLHRDGIVRRRLAAKCSGVFATEARRSA